MDNARIARLTIWPTEFHIGAEGASAMCGVWKDPVADCILRWLTDNGIDTVQIRLENAED